MGLFEESVMYLSHEERELALIEYLSDPRTCSCHICGECGVTIGDLIRQEFGEVYTDKPWAVPSCVANLRSRLSTGEAGNSLLGV
jgi:hypothetical protein